MLALGRRVAIIALVLAAVAPLPAQDRTLSAGDRIFQTTALHRIHVTIPAAEWAVLQTSTARGAAGPGRPAGDDYTDANGRLIHVGGGFGGYFPWARADVRLGDGATRAEFKNVGIRYKGNLSFSSTSAAAPLFANFKIKLDLHGTSGTWDGEKTFNLHAGVVDTSKMRDAIAYTIFRAAGVAAPRTAYVELTVTVPGVYQDTPAGLFTMIEDVNKKFLERALAPGTGLLMKPEGMRSGIQNLGAAWTSFLPIYRPDRDATAHEQQRVMEFAQLVNQPDVALFRSKIGNYLDIDQFFRFVAVNAMIGNRDSFLGGSHNFFLYLDPNDDRIRFIPWDQDLSMGSRGRGDNFTFDVMRPFSGDQPLIYWLLDDPARAAQYRAIVKDIGGSAFTAPTLLKLVDDLEKIGTGRGPSPRDFLTTRTAYVRQLIAGLGER